MGKKERVGIPIMHLYNHYLCMCMDWTRLDCLKHEIDYIQKMKKVSKYKQRSAGRTIN